MIDKEMLELLDGCADTAYNCGDVTVSKADMMDIHSYVERLQNEAAMARKEAERFKSSRFVIGVRGGRTHRLMEIIRSMEHDVIKEFLERLKAKRKQINITYNLDYDVVFVSDIERIAEEMVGDSDG